MFEKKKKFGEGLFGNWMAVIVLLIVSAIYFFFFVEPFSQMFVQYFLIAYPLFIMVFTAIVMHFVLQVSPMKSIRMSLAFAISLFLFNLVGFPLIVTSQGLPPNLPSQTQISPEVFIYKAIQPFNLPEWVNYAIVYPITLTLGIIFIMFLVPNKKQFGKVIREGIDGD